MSFVYFPNDSMIQCAFLFVNGMEYNVLIKLLSAVDSAAAVLLF